MTRNFELKRDQILVLIAKDFKLKYNSTALGFVWSMIVPIFTSIVYFFVFTILVRFGTKNYMLYLLCGNFLWHFFSSVVMMNGRVLLSNASLLKKTSFDRKLLIWGTFFTESIHFFLTIPILAGVMAFYGITPQWWSILPNFLLIFVSILFLSVGIGYAYAAINLQFRDMERIMTVIMQAWMFMTPIFIPIDVVREKLGGLAWIYETLNPMTGILCTWRDIFYQPGFHPERFIYILSMSLVVFFIGRAIFKKCEPQFAERM